MKTDIRSYTKKVESLSGLSLAEFHHAHEQFILDMASEHGGQIIKGAGDGYWITFPSVTNASLAAINMQRQLQTDEAGKPADSRLVIRIVITLGDVLSQQNDLFGMAMNLAARMETVTPPDEIYLSEAAWLALNQAEVRTSFVDEFRFEGVSETVKVYQVDHEHQTRIVRNQIIVFTDLNGYADFAESQPIAIVENLISHLDRFHNQVCKQFGGIIRMVGGDHYFMTFTASDLALTAVESLLNQWDQFARQNQISNPIHVGIHKGDLYLFGSCLYGKDINRASALERSARQVFSSKQSGALVSDNTLQELEGSDWEKRFVQVKLPQTRSEIEEMGIYQLVRDK